MIRDRHQPQSYQQPQRRPNAIQEAVQMTLDDRDIAEALLDRRRPLPDWMANNLEQCVNEYKKVLLGIMDAKYGLDGSVPPMRRRLR